MDKLLIYTDGGCSGNPGPGGWAYLIVDSGSVQEEWGAENATTNNRMELLAVISALNTLMSKPELPSRPVEVYTDSQYVQKGISQWIHSWKKNGWKTASRDPVKNRDLWQLLDSQVGTLSISWHWVKGHAGNEYNERCDELTQIAIASLKT